MTNPRIRSTLALALALALALGTAGPALAQENGPDAALEPEPTLCITCHEKQQGSLKAAVDEWRMSSHAKNGVSCDGCHRGNPDDERFAHSPGDGFVGAPRLRDVPYFCGRCHAEIKEKHLGSPHGAHGLPSCVTCHGDHAIVKPDPSAIISESRCTECHSFEPAATSLASLEKARDLLTELDENVERIEHIPAVREHLEVVQKEMRLDRAGVVTTFHSFRIGEIDALGMNVGRLEKVLKRLYERETKRQENITRERPIIVILMGFLVLGTYLGFVVFHGTGSVHREQESSTS